MKIFLFLVGLIVLLNFMMRSGLTFKNAIDRLEGKAPTYNGDGMIEKLSEE